MAKGNTIANAYVNLIPSAEGFSGKVADAIGEGTEQGSQMALPGFSNLLTGFAQGIGQAAFSIIGQLGQQALDVVGDIGKQAYEVVKSSVESYADYEQLTGGVETLFGKEMKMADYINQASVSAQQAVKDFKSLGTGEVKLLKYAEEAYKTAGMSVNEYMETSIQGAASMISSLNGNTSKAADLVNMSIIDMSDNVNKMGTSMESVQNAYRGFAKGQFNMLDNLALGYGGTKKEMERLLEDAEKFSGVKYDMDKYSDIVQAIHVVQTEMGITGTTAEEASSTISGSLSTVKSAWQNLLTGLANEDADIGKLVQNLIDSVFGTDEENGFLDNLLPRIEQAISGLGNFVKTVAEKFPGIATEYLPVLVESVITIIDDIIKGLVDSSDIIIESLGDMMKAWFDNLSKLYSNLFEDLPAIIDMAFNFISAFVDNWAQFFPLCFPVCFELIQTILDAILKNLPMVIDMAITITEAISEGMLQNLDVIMAAVIKIVAALVAAFAQLLPQIVYAGLQIAVTLITSLAEGIFKMLTEDFWKESLESIQNAFIDIDWVGIADKCMDGLAQGFKKGVDRVKESARNAAESIGKVFTGEWQIKSPSRVFKEYGEMLDEGLAIGIESGESVDASVRLAKSINDDFRNTVSAFGYNNTTSNNETMLDLLKEQNDLLWQILNKNYGRSDKEIFNVVQKGAKEYTRQTGSFAFGR